MIFAAGLGTRLRPFTLEHPKALAPVGGVPMLRRVIEKLHAAGISDMVVNVHHFADQIIDYLRDNDNFGCKIKISYEDELLETGGGLLKARPMLDDGSGDPILIHNADIITDFPIAEMADTFRRDQADITLLADHRTTSRYFIFDQSNLLCGHINLKTGACTASQTLTNGVPPTCDTLADAGFKLLAFGGVHLFSTKALAALGEYAATLPRPDDPFSIVDFYTHNTDLRITPYTPAAPYRWYDIGKLSTIAQAEAAIL